MLQQTGWPESRTKFPKENRNEFLKRDTITLLFSHRYYIKLQCLLNKNNKYKILIVFAVPQNDLNLTQHPDRDHILMLEITVIVYIVRSQCLPDALIILCKSHCWLFALIINTAVCYFILRIT